MAHVGKAATAVAVAFEAAPQYVGRFFFFFYFWVMHSHFDFQSRLRAAFIHLFGSVVLATTAMLLVYQVWYPSPLAVAVGVSGIVLTMLAVDVVLGPLLTFTVYQKGKKSLRFDLTVILSIQLAAFGYGLWTIAQGRPVWLVFNADRFDIVQVSSLDQRYIDEARVEFRSLSWTGPKWVAAINPTDIHKRNQLILESAGGGSDLPQRPDLYVPIDSETTSIRARSKPIQELTQFNSAEAVHAVTVQWPQATAWLPLMSRNVPMVVLLSQDMSVPLAVVDLRPWD